jgi:DNA adenine methylase
MKSYLGYLGGKSKLAGTIIPMIPNHRCYCEVFAGAAWVLFRKEPSKVEIINDINFDLINLYRVVKHHLEEFVRYFKWALVSREEFERLKEESPETLTDIQRAARFYYLLKGGFGAKVTSPAFGISPTQPSRLNLLRIEEDLSAAHLRLARVYIENLPYAELISRHDRPETFFYVDPPYHGHENDYGKGVFGREDFSTLRDLLAGIQGKFLMSINDTPEIRSLFKGFTIKEAATTYTAAGAHKKKRVTELLISSYRI